jgi:hypothetical protein
LGCAPWTPAASKNSIWDNFKSNLKKYIYMIFLHRRRLQKLIWTFVDADRRRLENMLPSTKNVINHGFSRYQHLANGWFLHKNQDTSLPPIIIGNPDLRRPRKDEIQGDFHTSATKEHFVHISVSQFGKRNA